MSGCDSVPPEGSLGRSFGLKLYELAALDGVPDHVLEARCRVLDEMLASDPLSIFSFVPLPTTWANGLCVSVGIRDDLRIKLTLAANNPELVGHIASGDLK